MTSADRTLAREHDADLRRLSRKAERRSALDKAEELAPKPVGKEGKMAEKRATNAENRAMRDKEVAGLEVDEATLMGGQDGQSSFAAALRARDQARKRREDKREAEVAGRLAENRERLEERKKQEDATMEM